LTTIARVAERAGVGVGTVSRVLNGSASVSERTRSRVLQVIDELGYEPNAAARALSTGRTGTLGVIAPFFTQPSVVERLRGVSRVVADAGYHLVLFDVEHPEPFAGLGVGGRLDGLLCVSLRPADAALERFASAGVPVALVDCEHPRLPGVSIDDFEGGRLAAEHLLSLGHTRIAYVGDDEHGAFGFTSSARRRIGAQRVLSAAGLELVVRRAPHGREQARSLAAALLAGDDPPSAIFAGSDSQALGVLEAAETAGYDVPGDLSVVGFDDIEVARYVGLTTVAQPLEQSGVQGARLLLRALEGAERTAQRLALRLVVRSTTAPPSDDRGTTPRGPRSHGWHSSAPVNRTRGSS
jgi:DNA-binding LacI/PurR family transcriptional regulator